VYHLAQEGRKLRERKKKAIGKRKRYKRRKSRSERGLRKREGRGK